MMERCNIYDISVEVKSIQSDSKKCENFCRVFSRALDPTVCLFVCLFVCFSGRLERLFVSCTLVPTGNAYRGVGHVTLQITSDGP